jgi:DNA-binding transcriptional LysR family regulator
VTIRQLEYLVAIADEPTWAAAADRVGVSPSALSQGVAELERRIGVEMFERNGRRRVVRTSAGPVVAHARQVLALTGDLVDWSARLGDGHIGSVRLGIIDVAAVTHHSTTLAAFRAERPDVELLLRVAPSTELLRQLTDGVVDLVVCVEPRSAPSGIELVPLLDEELAVYSPSGRSTATPSRWGPWVLFPSGSHTRSLVEDRLRELGAPLDVVAESHQPEVLREMVRLGTGWTVLPRSQAESGDRPLVAGRVIAERRLVLARRAGATVDPAVDDLSARLRQAAPRRRRRP